MARPKGSKNKPKGAAKPPKGAKAPAAAKAAKPGTKPIGAAPAPETPAVMQPRKMITENNLKNVLREVEGFKDEATAITGSLREKIAYAVQHQHLNKEVFALMRRLVKKSPEKLLIFAEDFDHYWDILGLEKRVDSVGKLPLGNGASAEDADSDDGMAAAEGADAPQDATAGNAIEQDVVSRPQFTGAAPGGTVHMLPDRVAAKH